ncbi:MAG: CRISPR-associated endonuclease Cas2 [Bacteroidota bacterium]|nr:CRISPR-associated endonuclease Cas2 [Candidatus Kapabacteria bacterium]MDW8221019.1 CRISPR-associated endonuclease Cas2 [Bacteroidota bacterium]
MICWVLYDVHEDTARTKIAKVCKRAGLYRVQKSVFLGTLTESEKDALMLDISDLINEEHDSVYIFPMSKDELQATALLGQAFDKRLVTDSVRALFV